MQNYTQLFSTFSYVPLLPSFLINKIFLPFALFHHCSLNSQQFISILVKDYPSEYDYTTGVLVIFIYYRL